MKEFVKFYILDKNKGKSYYVTLLVLYVYRAPPNNVTKDLTAGLPPPQLLVRSSLPTRRFILMESQMSYKNPNNMDLFLYIFFPHYRMPCKLIKAKKCVIMCYLPPATAAPILSVCLSFSSNTPSYRNF